jgi:hypothetical protein
MGRLSVRRFPIGLLPVRRFLMGRLSVRRPLVGRLSVRRPLIGWPPATRPTAGVFARRPRNAGAVTGAPEWGAEVMFVRVASPVRRKVLRMRAMKPARPVLSGIRVVSTALASAEARGRSG